MGEKNIDKVFLYITIPAHLRVMTDVADLLHSSGRYKPVLLYYPSVVFDQNLNNCQSLPWDTFIWHKDSFVSKTLYNNKMEASKSFWDYFINKGFYRAAKKRFSFLPAPQAIPSLARQLFSPIIICFRLLVFAQLVLHFALINILQRFKRMLLSKEDNENDNKQRRLQLLLLNIYTVAWAAISLHKGALWATIYQSGIRFFMERLFSGISEQKVFDAGIAKLLGAEAPKLVILPEENLFYNSQYVVRAAHANSISVVVVPFTIVNTLEWAEAFYNIDSFQANTGFNRLVAKGFPKWVLEHRGHKLVLPVAHVLSCELFDMVPNNPWLINSGHADVIAAESKFMAEYYIRAGIKMGKIHLTGTLADDKIHSLISERYYYRKSLENRADIMIKQKVILIGLPPDQFGGESRPGCEFSNYDELVCFIVGTAISASDGEATVIINLHPRINLSDVCWLESLGARIITEPIENLVPLADLYIAVASATIRLGIACSIPVVNYDAYQYDYDDFKGLDGVCESKTKIEYERILRALIYDQAFYLKVTSAQKETAQQLCLIDGKAGERMLGLFDQLSITGTISANDR